MTKKINTACIVQSVDSVFTFQIGSITTGERILQFVLNYYHIHENRWFGLVHYDPQCQNKRLDLKKKIRLKDIQTYPGSSVMFHLTIILHPITSRFEIIQDSTRILLFKFELQRSMNDHEYHILPEWRALLAVTFARLTEWENPSRSAKSTIEKHFNKLVPQYVLNQYALTKEQMMNNVNDLYRDTLSSTCIELVQQSLDFLETSTIFGVQYFAIKNKKGTNLLLGIDSLGVVICLPTDRLNPMVVFNWSEIKHVTSCSKKLQIKPVKKEDPPLEFEAINSAHNDTIFVTLVENYQYFLQGSTLEGQGQVHSDKALKAQQLDSSRRKAELETKINEETYRAYVDSIVKEGSATENDTVILEEEFSKFKKAVEQQIVEVTKQIELEKSDIVADKDINVEKLKAEDIADIVIEEDKKDSLTVLAEADISLTESKTAQVDDLKAKLEQLSLQHAEDLKKLEEVKESTATSGEVKPMKATIIKTVPSQESEVKRREKIQKSIQKVGACSNSNPGQDEKIKTLRKMNESDGNKFKTLEKLRSNNNIRSRIDMFESL